MRTFWAQRGDAHSVTFEMRQQLAKAVAKEVEHLDVLASEVIVTVVSSEPKVVRVEACLPDAAASSEAVAALSKRFGTIESALALLEVSNLHLVFFEPPDVRAFVRGPHGMEVSDAGVVLEPTPPEPLDVLMAALHRRQDERAATAEAILQELEKRATGSLFQAAKATKVAELAGAASELAATQKTTKADGKAKLATPGGKEGDVQSNVDAEELAHAAALLQAAEDNRQRGASKPLLSLDWLFSDGAHAVAPHSPTPTSGAAPLQAFFTATDPVATYRKGEISLDQLPTMDRIAVLEADGADAATIDAERAKLRAEMAQWSEDAEALRVARAEETGAAIAMRDLTFNDIKAKERVFAEKKRLREEAERRFYTGAFEQARLKRLENARRARVVASEMQQSIENAKVEAEARVVAIELQQSRMMAEVDAEAAEEVRRQAAPTYRARAAKALADAALATANAEAAAAKLAVDFEAQVAAEAAAREAAAQANIAAATAEAALRELELELGISSAS